MKFKPVKTYIHFFVKIKVIIL